jgi:hypothetical protein
MATSGSNNENLQPGEGTNNQQAIDAGDGPPKTAKQLAKDAEKAEKLRKFNEKQAAKEKADKQVSLIMFHETILKSIFLEKRKS